MHRITNMNGVTPGELFMDTYLGIILCNDVNPSNAKVKMEVLNAMRNNPGYVTGIIRYVKTYYPDLAEDMKRIEILL